MKFLVDAQLPRRLVRWLMSAGHDAIHTLDLHDGNRTSDMQLNELANQEQRAVIAKDADFVDSHLLQGRPAKLLLVSTGNINNQELEALFVPLINSGYRARIRSKLATRTRARRNRRTRLSGLMNRRNAEMAFQI